MTAALERHAAVEATYTTTTGAGGEESLNRMRAKSLHTAIGDVVGFAATAALGVPAITAVRIEATDGQLVAIATDRFALGVSRVDYAGADFAVTVALSDVKTLLGIAKTVKRDEGVRTVDIVVDGNRVAFWFSTGEAITVAGISEEFPPAWRRLIPTTDEGMGDSGLGVGYDPALLARFAKVRPDQRGRRAVLFPVRSGSRLGGTIVQIGEDFIGVVMPVRGPGGLEPYQPPSWLAGSNAGGCRP